MCSLATTGTVNYRQRRPLRLSRDPGRIAIRGPAPVRAEEEISAISGAISPDKISVDEIEAWDPKGGPPTPLLVGMLYSRHGFDLLWTASHSTVNLAILRSSLALGN